ncbi:hypothetical protein AMATHDRAFT_74464 [Amanita thiersii Skay4041]|uniref:Cytochrome P450 n=1 Tax=Amanita thiersii Skay4041 TaxID=703135 RepID=A0A2A9NV82_9AGAR|nr:hypothetical protein AMATHDRAFT_74464 [Amanita thiersii Skay4041]
MSDITISLASLAILLVVYRLYKRWRRISIAHVPGPEPVSFLLGNLGEIYQCQAMEAEFKWQQIYGDVVRFKASFGEDRLLVSDPKALQYIYQTAGYRFHKQPERREMTRLISGRGILWADGAIHRRHRKVMLPGFGGPEVKAFIPLFSAIASQLTEKWKEIISDGSGESAVIDVPHWASRATMDAIGEAAFDYRFGVIDHEGNALGKAYFNLFADTFGTPSKAQIIATSIMGHIPTQILEWLGDYLPSPKLHHARHTAEVATNVAKSLVDSKFKALLQGQGKRDIMSLLVKANVSEKETARLNEEELLAQMRTIILAGHETTANCLSWTLLELSRHPEMQKHLRNEIRTMEKNIQAREDTEFSPRDYEAMPYLSAVLKESLRYHPVAFNSFRQAADDDVLPLSTPIITVSGEVITELPIPKGTKIVTSIGGYNRNQDIFGQDAHIFNPERWLRPDGVKKMVSIGVYSNLLSFAGGVRSCIGWKFALLEMQTFLVRLINDFEFSLTPEAHKVRREPCLVMIPTVEGQVERGAQLPLEVRIAHREEVE